MKKMNIGVVFLLLVLVGCTPLTKKNLSTEKKEETKKIVVDREEFIPQMDIINPEFNVKFVDERSEIEIIEGKQVNISEKEVKKGIAYKKGESEPFTGTFVATIGLYNYYIEQYKDGKLNGNKIWYSEAGRIGLKESYVDGIKDGVQESYYRDTGNIHSKVNYVKGKISGDVIFYSNNGDILYQENFKNGTGLWKAYWSNEELKEKGNRVSGFPDGEWRFYTRKGELEKIIIYKKGALLSQEWLR